MGHGGSAGPWDLQAQPGAGTARFGRCFLECHCIKSDLELSGVAPSWFDAS